MSEAWDPENPPRIGNPFTYDEQADKFWSFYRAETDLYDSNMLGTWKSNMEITLIFAGLFSATVTAFIIESQKLLKQDPADVTNHLLDQLLAAQLQAGATNTSSSALLLPSSVPTFRASGTAITVNILWFTSLVCTLGAALCCILVLQLVQHFSRRIQQPTRPLERARVRVFLADGIERWKIDSVVDYIPTLLHMSLFLFLTGLIVFSVGLSIPISAVVVAIVFLLSLVYSALTLAPVLDLAAPFETVFTRLSARLSAFKFDFDNSDPPPPLDVSALDISALVWARDNITDNHRFEKFLETVPGFLIMRSEEEGMDSKEEGHNTWNAAYPDSSQPLQRRISQLLRSCSSINSMDSNVNQHRALVCIEALSSISQHETKYSPQRTTEQSTITQLSKYITLAIAQKHSLLLITKGICTLVVLAHQHFLSKPDLVKLPNELFSISRKADEALRNIETNRDALKAHHNTYFSRPHRYEGIQQVAQQYFEMLNTLSQSLHTWRSDVAHPLREYEKEKRHDLYSWYSLLFQDRYYILSYHNPSSNTSVKVDLYALQVMALMRRIGVYPSLPEVTSEPFPNSQKLSKPLCQELDPLFRLLSLLEPELTSDQIDFSLDTERKSNESWYRQVPYPKERPILVEYLGPFSTVAYILENSIGSRSSLPVVALLDLVLRFKSFAPQLVEPHIVRGFLDNIFSQRGILATKYSQILFIAILRVVLDWEVGYESTSSSCPLSSSDTTFLLGFLLKITFYDSAVDKAEEWLVHPSFSRSDIDSDADADTVEIRMQAVYNHITAHRHGQQ